MIIGGVLGAATGALSAGVTADTEQKKNIKVAQTKARAEQDEKLDLAANQRAASATQSSYGGMDLLEAGAGSPYSSGSAYDSWHASKWG